MPLSGAIVKIVRSGLLNEPAVIVRGNLPPGRIANFPVQLRAWFGGARAPRTKRPRIRLRLKSTARESDPPRMLSSRFVGRLRPQRVKDGRAIRGTATLFP